MSVIGDNLNALCARGRITNADLAKAAGVGPSTVSKWFNGQQYPREEVVQRICDHYEWDYDAVHSLAKGGAAQLFAELEAVGWDHWSELGIDLRKKDRLDRLHARFLESSAKGGWDGQVPSRPAQVPLLELDEVLSYLKGASAAAGPGRGKRLRRHDSVAVSSPAARLQGERASLKQHANVARRTARAQVRVPDDVWAAHPCAFALRSTDPALFGTLHPGYVIVCDPVTRWEHVSDNCLLLCMPQGAKPLVRRLHKGNDSVVLSAEPIRADELDAYPDISCPLAQLNALATVEYCCQG